MNDYCCALCQGIYPGEAVGRWDEVLSDILGYPASRDLVEATLLCEDCHGRVLQWAKEDAWGR